MRKIDVKDWIMRKGYRKKILADEMALAQKGCLVQIVSVEPGDEIKPHYHKIHTEFFYILCGNGVLFFDDNWVRAQPGDAFVCEPRDVHGVINDTRDEFRLMVFKTNFLQDDTCWEVSPYTASSGI